MLPKLKILNSKVSVKPAIPMITLTTFYHVLRYIRIESLKWIAMRIQRDLKTNDNLQYNIYMFL